MSKIKISRYKIEKAAVDIDALSRRANNNKYFSFFIIRNIHYLTPEIQSINSIRQSMVPSEAVLEYEDKRIALAESLCEREDDKPKMNTSIDNFGNQQKTYIFNEKNQAIFSEKLKELSKEYSEPLAEFEASVNEFSYLMNEQIEIDVVKISFKHIPDDINITNIVDFIEESKEEVETLI